MLFLMTPTQGRLVLSFVLGKYFYFLSSPPPSGKFSYFCKMNVLVIFIPLYVVVQDEQKLTCNGVCSEDYYGKGAGWAKGAGTLKRSLETIFEILFKRKVI